MLYWYCAMQQGFAGKGQKMGLNNDKPRLYILPGAASGAGSAMAAPLKKPVTSMAKPAEPIPAVGLQAAKKAAKAKAYLDLPAENAAPEEDLREEDLKTEIEEIEMATAKPNFEKITAQAANHNQEQLEAFIKSSNLLLAGTQNILKTYATLAQESVEKNSEAVKTLLGCKTLNELTETQTRLAQESFEGFVTNATKLSELSVKVATESFEPLNTQLSKTVQKATEAAAA